MNIPQEAVEAGARASAIARRGVTAHVKDLDRQAAQATLTAALPVLEQQIKEQVAAEILDGLLAEPTRMHVIDWREGMENAAQIARGKDQP